MALKIRQIPDIQDPGGFYELSKSGKGFKIKAEGLETVVNDTEENIRRHIAAQWNRIEITTPIVIHRGANIGFSTEELQQLKLILVVRTFHHGPFSPQATVNRTIVSRFAESKYGQSIEADLAAAAVLDMNAEELRHWLDTRKSFLESR